MGDVSQPEMIRMRFFINARGFHYGEIAAVPDCDWVWDWFSLGLCTFADDEDYGVLESEAVEFAEPDPARIVGIPMSDDEQRARLSAGMFVLPDEITFTRDIGLPSDGE